MGRQALLLVVMTLASYRLWRLIGYDDVTGGVRDHLREWRPVTYELVSCPWCLGSWTAFVVVGVTASLTEVWWPVLQALAAATGVGWMHNLVERHTED